MKDFRFKALRFISNPNESKKPKRVSWNFNKLLKIKATETRGLNSKLRLTSFYQMAKQDLMSKRPGMEENQHLYSYILTPVLIGLESNAKFKSV